MGTGTGWARAAACASGECVEVRHSSGRVWVRNGQTAGFLLDFSPAEWDVFIAAVKDGQFDRPEVSS